MYVSEISDLILGDRPFSDTGFDCEFLGSLNGFHILTLNDGAMIKVWIKNSKVLALSNVAELSLNDTVN